MVRCAVVGASGYSGAELVGLLALHTEAKLVSLHADSSAGKDWAEVYPGFAHLHRGPIEAFEPETLHGLDVVFLALPAGAASQAASQLYRRVGLVIDLSGGLRLPDAEAYLRWYGEEHPAPALLGQAAYSLPELHGDALPAARLVSCAGCYATAAQLAAAPALAGLAVEPRLVVSGMSGTSGAGRKADVGLIHSEIHGDLKAYRVGRHPHGPEIAAGLTRHAARKVSVTFVPHLVPLERGLLATAVLRATEELDQDAVLAHYRQAYALAPLVRVVDYRSRQPRVRDVVRTSFCDVSPTVDQETGDLVVTAVIDNLLKGAAGQAVQVMNLIQGFPETAGLLPQEARS